MKKATVRQVNTLLTMLINNVDSDVVDADILQRELIVKPDWAATQFVRWVNNGGQFVFGSPPVLQLATSFDPATFEGLGKGWDVWKGLADSKGLEGELEIYEPADLQQFDAGQMIFEHFLIDDLDPKKREEVIGGEVKLGRAKDSKKILLGGRSFLALLNDYKTNGENSVLEWLRKNRGVTWMDFPGLILRSPNGNRCVLFLGWFGKQWHWSFSWLDSNWYRVNPSALLASIKKQVLDSRNSGN